jgi:hypothetical protein
MSKKKIRIQMKGSTRTLVTDTIDTEEAERLLRDEVLPKIGKDGAIELPGLIVNAKETVSAQAFVPSSPAMPAVGRR